eukprot:s3253_g10.t2
MAACRVFVQKDSSMFSTILVRVTGSRPNVATYALALKAYEQGDRWPEGFGLLQQMRDVAVHPNTVTYNTFISLCTQANRWADAVAAVQQLHEDALRPTVITYGSVIAACGKGSEATKALRFLQEMEAAKLQPSVVAVTSAIRACEQGGLWQDALRLFERLKAEDGLPPDLRAYNATLSASEKGAKWGEALEVLKELEEGAADSSGRLKVKPPKPDAISYNAIITACGNGLRWDLSLMFLQRLRDGGAATGVVADVISFNATASACERASQWLRALALLDDLLEDGIQPDVICCGSVVDRFILLVIGLQGWEEELHISIQCVFCGEEGAVIRLQDTVEKLYLDLRQYLANDTPQPLLYRPGQPSEDIPDDANAVCELTHRPSVDAFAKNHLTHEALRSSSQSLRSGHELYNKLLTKSYNAKEKFGDETMTYIRIGYKVAKHHHGGCAGSVRVLHGALNCQLFDGILDEERIKFKGDDGQLGLPNEEQSVSVLLLTAGDTTWLNRQNWWVHQAQCHADFDFAMSVHLYKSCSDAFAFMRPTTGYTEALIKVQGAGTLEKGMPSNDYFWNFDLPASDKRVKEIGRPAASGQSAGPLDEKHALNEAPGREEGPGPGQAPPCQGNTLIGACATGLNWQLGLAMLQRMPELKVEPEQLSHRAVLLAAARADVWSKALVLQDDMRSASLPLDSACHSTLLMVCQQHDLGPLEEQLLQELSAEGLCTRMFCLPTIHAAVFQLFKGPHEALNFAVLVRQPASGLTMSPRRSGRSFWALAVAAAWMGSVYFLTTSAFRVLAVLSDDSIREASTGVSFPAHMKKSQKWVASGLGPRFTTQQRNFVGFESWPPSMSRATFP